MIYCDACKTKEATQKSSNLNLCDSCYIELMSSFTYYIAGKEVTKEEYDKFIKGEN
jgi:hypothetical protein